MLIICTAVIFTIFYVFPTADAATLRAGRNARPDQIDAIRTSLGLDDSLLVQFLRYLTQVFTPFDWFGAAEHGGTGPFNFGISIFQSNTPVKEIIFDRLPATVWLVTGAVIIWLAVAIPVGIISAVRRRSLLDRTTMITTLVFISAPVFWLGLVALYLFAQDVGQFPIFPGIGAYSDATDFWGKFGAMLLPWMVLAAATAAIYARYLRSSMIDVMSEDYIRTARAKGLPERTVIMRHGLRSAITPLVTLLGLDIGTLLAGNAILTESVFNIPGVGKELVTSIQRSDLVVIQGIVLFGAFFIVTFNLIVDIAYAYLDPRVRYQ
jgi:peptide/nickel transport system permease protein